MSSWTLFVDESGRFEPGQGRWPSGIRVLGGPLVPLAAAGASEWAATAIRAAVSAAGVGDSAYPIHAADYAHPPRFVARLRTGSSNAVALAQEFARATEGRTEEESRRTRAWRQVADAGSAVLTRIRQSLGRSLAAVGGRIFLVSEHGVAGAGLPANAPYDRMLGAILEQAALRAALGESGPHSLEIVVATRRGSGRPTALGPWQQALSAARLSDVAMASEPTFHQADETPGLQIADVVVHGLGPGRTYMDVVSEGAVRMRTSAWLDQYASDLFGPAGAEVREMDAHAVHGRLRRMVVERDKPTTFANLDGELSAMSAKAPPKGTFPTSVIQGQGIASQLKGRR